MSKSSKGDLIKITVKNDRFLSKLGRLEIYLTPEIKEYLEKEVTQKGETLLTLFGKGMALRGFKHLIEKIREKDKNCKIIFTNGKNVKTNRGIAINYNDYRKTTGPRFFALYRKIGLESASFYLNKYFPDIFDIESDASSEAQIKFLDRHFPELIERLTKQKKKNKRAIIERTSKIIGELSDKKSVLRREVEELEELRQKSNIFYFKSKINEFEGRLLKKYPETKGNNSWQNWIYSNNWLFGINYQQPIEKFKINIPGSMPDFLFPTLDGFLDILEIKLPGHDVISKDPSHTGSFAWSSEANRAIGQIVNYLNEIELNQLQLTDEIKRVYKHDFYLIKPRAFILIGDKSGWDEEWQRALRKLNYSLHGIEVITYTDLLNRGKEIVDKYSREQH